MKQTRTLYNRLISAFIITTFLISSLFGLLVYYAMKYTEDDILTRRVQMEREYYFNEYLKDKKNAKLPNSTGLTSYLSTSSDLPDWLRDQEPGIREIDEREEHVGISPLPDNSGLLYLVLSEYESSSLEQQRSTLFMILIAVGLVITLIGMVVGILLGRYITTPLTQLTAQVNEFEKSNLELDRFLPFHGVERSDEVGALCRSFTQLVKRLDKFLYREKQFTRYASHKFRTPLTIIRNALAVLRLPNPETETQQRNINRLENAAIEMEGLIDTFLLLGRENKSPVTESINATRTLKTSLDKHSYLNEKKHIQFHSNIAPDVVIQSEARLLQILFDNIIRNMFQHGLSEAKITLNEKGLYVENDIDPDHLKSTTGNNSYGLNIIQDISQYCRLTTETLNDKKHFSISILFNAV